MSQGDIKVDFGCGQTARITADADGYRLTLIGFDGKPVSVVTTKFSENVRRLAAALTKLADFMEAGLD